MVLEECGMIKPMNCFVCSQRQGDVCNVNGKKIISGHDLCKKFVPTAAVDSFSSMFVAMTRASIHAR